jgi:hypothetical protein
MMAAFADNKFCQFSRVVIISEELNIACQGCDRGETTGSAGEPLHVMVEFGVDRCDRTGFLLVESTIVKCSCFRIASDALFSSSSLRRFRADG